MKWLTIDRAARFLYWAGLALLFTAMMLAITNPHPKTLDGSALYTALLVCALIVFAIGGTIHFTDIGRRKP